jgi:DNA adenine methylase
MLPTIIEKVGVPPVKCQGIKTKLVRFIGQNLRWEGKGTWIEPFLGSGVVVFNLAPERALVADSNRHIIELYRDIQSGAIDEKVASAALYDWGKRLAKEGESFFYEVRDEFNRQGGSLRLLFLNRSCFNGVMRFNQKGKYNVPFGRKPERFRQAYITKIANQVKWVRRLMKNRDWEFRVSDWRQTLAAATAADFVYLDPPYIGRHTDYYTRWNHEHARELAKVAAALPCGFALSMWKENKFRQNKHLDNCWRDCEVRTSSHFYHVGSTESLRHEMVEALVVKPGFVAMAEELNHASERPQEATRERLLF